MKIENYLQVCTLYMEKFIVKIRLCKGKVGNKHSLTTRYLVIHETQVDKEQIKWINSIVEIVVSIFFPAV